MNEDLPTFLRRQADDWGRADPEDWWSQGYARALRYTADLIEREAALAAEVGA